MVFNDSRHTEIMIQELRDHDNGVHRESHFSDSGVGKFCVTDHEQWPCSHVQQEQRIEAVAAAIKEAWLNRSSHPDVWRDMAHASIKANYKALTGEEYHERGVLRGTEVESPENDYQSGD